MEELAAVVEFVPVLNSKSVVAFAEPAAAVEQDMAVVDSMRAALVVDLVVAAAAVVGSVVVVAEVELGEAVADLVRVQVQEERVVRLEVQVAEHLAAVDLVQVRLVEDGAALLHPDRQEVSFPAR